MLTSIHPICAFALTLLALTLGRIALRPRVSSLVIKEDVYLVQFQWVRFAMGLVLFSIYHANAIFGAHSDRKVDVAQIRPMSLVIPIPTVSNCAGIDDVTSKALSRLSSRSLQQLKTCIPHVRNNPHIFAA